MIPLGVLASAHVAAAAGGPLLTYTDVGTASMASGGSVTLAAKDVGTAHAAREIVVVASISGSTTFSRYINACTIGGVSATADLNHIGNTGGGSVWRAPLPAGTTADVVVSFVAAASNTADVFIFASSSALSVVDAALVSNSSGETSLTNTLDAVSGGHRVAFAAGIGNVVTIDPTDISISTFRACSHAVTTAPTDSVTAENALASSGRFRLGAVTYGPA